MFDILVLLGIGIISGLGVNIGYQSNRHFKKVQSFVELQSELANRNRQLLEVVTEEIKVISSNFKQELAEITLPKLPNIPCLKYESGECSLCGGSGECKLEAVGSLATKPQKKGMVVR